MSHCTGAGPSPFLLPASSQLDLLDELHGGLCLSFEITVAVTGEEELFAPDM